MTPQIQDSFCVPNATMGQFADLFDPRANMVDVSRESADAIDSFPDVVRRSRLHLYQRFDPIESRGLRALVGVIFVLSDMKMLDRTERQLAKRRGAVRVDVFPLWDCDEEDVRRAFSPPANVPLSVTPLVAIWEDGRFVAMDVGQAGEVLLYHHLRDYAE
jgi:hypothetical protein